MISVEKPGSPEELVHFGAKGMKWGVHKERETSGQKSSKSETSGWSDKKRNRVENRAKGHDVTANYAQRRIDYIKANPSKWNYTQRQNNINVVNLEQYRDVHLKAAKDLRSGHLTDFQKKVVIGASATAVVLTAYGTFKLVDTGITRQALSKNKPFIKNSSLSRKMKPSDVFAEVVKPINSDFGKLGTKVNCRRTTFAYEMRRRGFDVVSTKTATGSGQTPAGLMNAIDPKSHLNTSLTAYSRALKKDTGTPIDIFMRASKGLGKEKIPMVDFESPNTAARKIYETLAKHPEGARGELSVAWKQGGAHSMAWEIFNGKPVIFDNQIGKTFLSATDFAKSGFPEIREAGQTRLDNIELNTDYLKRWVKNAK